MSKWVIRLAIHNNAYRRGLLFVAALGLICAIVLPMSLASSPTASLESENGTTSTAASVVSDTSASGSSAVKFGSGVVASCSGSPNTPGGADPWGGCFPGSDNTGVPAGTTLTTYTGPTSIRSCGTVIQDAIINSSISIVAGNGTASPSTPCVTIKNSKILGTVGYSGGGDYGPLLMTDDEVDAPNDTGVSTISGNKLYLWRINVHGGAKGAIQCYGDCEIHDSWTHDFYHSAADSHYDGIGSNGLDGTPMVIDHNTVNCSFYATDPNPSGGCSADLGLFGDFSPISNVTANNNLFMGIGSSSFDGSGGGSYCVYGGYDPGKAYGSDPTNDKFTNNIFQRGTSGNCGYYGPVAKWTDANGNVWSGNKWDDGTSLDE